jgi:hypothetical protein
MVSLNELAALMLVLKDISVKDLCFAAMQGFSEQGNVKAQDNANVCSAAIQTFLK